MKKKQTYWRVEIIGSGEHPTEKLIRDMLSMVTTGRSFSHFAYVTERVGRVAYWKATKEENP